MLFLTPPVLILGLALGFIHPHRSLLAGNLAGVGWAALRWVGIFFFTAVPEELFFRAWVQNLLERRVGRRAALGIASVVFGLSHFNKRSAHFNWRYVLLATIAGIFYGRAWREQRRVLNFGDHAYLRGLDLVDVVLAGGTARVSHGYRLGCCWGDGDFTPPQRGLLPLPHVQLRETKNGWRLDRSHRRGDGCDIPCLVDASNVRTVNGASQGSMKIEMLRQLWCDMVRCP